jgi:uncharacterized protein (DUF924 family)
MADLDPRAAEVVHFWREAGPDKWFRKDDAFDAEFRERFLELHFAASRRELDHWTAHPDGVLALVILLDQFPRNCFRGSGHMYATDPLARHFVRDALAAGHDQMVEEKLRLFFYLPLSHSECLADQHIAVERNIPLGEETLKHALGHRDIVQRFGHFPHRNRILGRQTSSDEQAFLDSGGFAG